MLVNLSAFAEHLKARGYGEKTIKAYVYTVNMLVRMAGGIVDENEVELFGGLEGV